MIDGGGENIKWMLFKGLLGRELFRDHVTPAAQDGNNFRLRRRGEGERRSSGTSQEFCIMRCTNSI